MIEHHQPDGLDSPVFQAILKRRSLRRYEQRPIPKPLIESLLLAATWAPSAHNRQPWRFTVVERAITKMRLAQAMGKQLRRDLKADHVSDDVIEKDVNRSYDRITSAPILILVALSMKDMDIYPDEHRAHNEYIMAVQSTAMAGQNLLLAAHDFGLGACWMCAPLFCPNTVNDVLELPADWQPQGLVTIGYPAQERQKTREPVQDFVLWR